MDWRPEWRWSRTSSRISMHGLPKRPTILSTNEKWIVLLCQVMIFSFVIEIPRTDTEYFATECVISFASRSVSETLTKPFRSTEAKDSGSAYPSWWGWAFCTSVSANLSKWWHHLRKVHAFCQDWYLQCSVSKRGYSNASEEQLCQSGEVWRSAWLRWWCLDFVQPLLGHSCPAVYHEVYMQATTRAWSQGHLYRDFLHHQAHDPVTCYFTYIQQF